MGIVLLIETFFLIGLATLGMYDGIRLARIPLLVYDPIGPGWYLVFISSMLLICGVTHLLINTKHGGIGGRKYFSFHFGPAVQLLILIVLYATAVPIVGYYIGSTFFFVFSLRIYGARWSWSVLIGLVFSAAFILGFSILARIPLP